MGHARGRHGPGVQSGACGVCLARAARLSRTSLPGHRPAAARVGGRASPCRAELFLLSAVFISDEAGRSRLNMLMAVRQVPDK